jgi:hypothetical protein
MSLKCPHYDDPCKGLGNGFGYGGRCPKGYSLSNHCEFREPKDTMSKSKKSIKALECEIARLTKALHELNKTYTFKHKAGRPVMVVQIGDAATGWIGNSETIAFLIRELKQACVDDVYNIVIYHYAAKFTILEGNRPQFIR